METEQSFVAKIRHKLVMVPVLPILILISTPFIFLLIQSTLVKMGLPQNEVYVTVIDLVATLISSLPFLYVVWLQAKKLQQYALLAERHARELAVEKQRLFEQNEKLLTLIESSPVGIAVLDVEGRIQIWNRVAEQIYGWKQEEVTGKLSPTMCHEDFFDVFDKVKQGKSFLGEEVRRKKKNGASIDISLSMAGFNSTEGVFNGIIVIAKDITMRKKQERKRQLDLEMARKVQESVLSPPLVSEHITIHSTYLPSYKLSGDMYCWYQIDENRYGIIMMDVMGHGLSSCLISMSIRSLLRGMIVRVREPEQIFLELNKHMSGLFQEQIGFPSFFTATYLLVDTREQSIEYFNAGNPPGFLFQESTQEILQLTSTSAPIGLSNSGIAKKEKIYYQGKARLMLYSDGLLGKASVKTGVAELQEAFLNHRKLDLQTFSSVMATGDNQDDICVVVADLMGQEKNQRENTG